MKIIQLEAENVKRLRAVEISPDGTVQVITGKNGAGKSSVLDAIWLALGGGPASKQTDMPVRKGEKKAHVRLDLGDLVVTRSWSGDKSTLKVEGKDGGLFKSPQGMLDALVGRLSFDPLEFTLLRPADQRDALLDLVELSFDPADLDRQRHAKYDERAAVNRAAKQLEGELAGIPIPDPGTPDEEVSASELINQITEAEAGAREFDRCDDAVIRHEIGVKAAKKALVEAERLLAAAQKQFEALPDQVDTTPLREQLATVEETNTAVRAKRKRNELKERHVAALEGSEELTAAIEAIDTQKADGLAAAVFPVEGLGFDEAGVTYQGVPFSQASSAEQIRVSLGMAMASNPRLRVIRILDGSLLDDENLALITEMAADRDFQIWIERVGTTAEGSAVLIEDGEVSS